MDLIAKSPDADVRVFHLPDGDFEVAIGRGTGCDIQLADNGVSRRHAVLSCESGVYYIEDTGSRAGTFLMGAPVIGKTQLGVDMEVKIGRFTAIITDVVDDDSSSSIVAGAAGIPPPRLLLPRPPRRPGVPRAPPPRRRPRRTRRSSRCATSSRTRRSCAAWRRWR